MFCKRVAEIVDLVALDRKLQQFGVCLLDIWCLLLEMVALLALLAQPACQDGSSRQQQASQ